MAMAEDQPTVPLGGDVALPLVGLGTWQMTGQECYRAVRHALEVGYRHIDTATMYRNEREVGRAVRDSGVSREDVLVATKLPPRDAGRERKTLEASLRALGTEYVDLWLVHWPPARGASPQVWKQFLALRDEGMTRAVGVSNYDVAELDELVMATGEAPQVNQIRGGRACTPTSWRSTVGEAWFSRATARSRPPTSATRCSPRSPAVSG